MRTLLVLLCVFEICFPLFASKPEGGVAHTYTIRGPHRVDMQKTVECTGVSSVSLREGEFMKNVDEETVVAEIAPATTKLELTVTKDGLMVRAGTLAAKQYTVTADNESFLAGALAERDPPAINSIVMDKEKGYVSWTVHDRMTSKTQFFVCK